MIYRLSAELPTIDAAAGDESKPASITGIAVPWAPTTATVMGGQRVAFQRGAFDVNQKPAKLIENHDLGQLRGVVNALADLEEGLGFTATFATTRASADAVELVKAGAYDAVSVGAEPIESFYDKELKATVVTKARLIELSLVAVPAFPDAQITEIAASAEVEEAETQTQTDPEEESTMSEVTPAAVEAAVPTQPLLFAQPAREFKLPSMGEYIAKFIKGGAEFAEFNAKIKAAAPDVTTSDLDGVLPTPVIAPVYNNFRGIRPVVDAVGVRAMPQAGKVFIRPKVTTHTSIGTVTQGTTITSGTFVVDDVQVTKAIYGGYVELSEASMDWSSPEVLNALLDDMARIYANQTDDVAADALVSGTTNTNNFTSANIADPTEWVTWIYQAASDILTDSNGNLPTHLFLAPNRWASLGELEDGSGRPLFPQVGPMNAYGNLAPGAQSGNAFGLQVVVDRNFASGTLLIGDATSGGFECWEQQKGAVSIENPSLLARTIAWRGYFAPVMVDATKFIKAAFV